MKVPEDIKVYTVKVDDDGNGVTKTELAAGTVVPAGTGLLIGAKEGSYGLEITTDDAAEISGNDLKTAAGNVVSDGTTCYALTNADGKVGFALVDSKVVVPAGKAYLKVDNASAAKFFSMDGDLTGIATAGADTPKADGIYYTLQGVKTAKPGKGLYIRNGKKVVVK